MLQRIIMAEPRGPCAGVNRAIEIVEAALAKYGPPIYVNHDLVHNREVVSSLKQRGVLFGDDPASLPQGSVYLFSAHGVAPGFRRIAANAGLRLIDATCPLVTKVHTEALRYAAEGIFLFYIGHRGHPEVRGAMGVTAMRLIETLDDARGIDPDSLPAATGYAVLTQTTLSVDDTAGIIAELSRRVPGLLTPKAQDICYATANRQQAAKALAEVCDFVAVVGSPHSSNSNRLVEAVKLKGTPSLLIESGDQLPAVILDTITVLGVTSGASVPESITLRLVQAIQKRFPGIQVDTLKTMQEDMRFSLPQI